LGWGVVLMDVRIEIARQVEKLPPDRQNQVLQFVNSLAAEAGVSGATMRQFAFTLDAESARQITRAIEEGCEQVDVSEW
jgi:SOS-response transcriptional repressor LexA